MDLLMPHVGRFRSLVILTDTFSQMYAALNRLSDPNEGTPEGAPLLESIVLKRCNEYAGSSAQFFPREMKPTAEMPFAALLNRNNNTFLPRLRELRLHGVHINWSNLPPLLDQSSTVSTPKNRLRTLELSEHPYDVRPSLFDFQRLLHSCSGLQTLKVSVSGPSWDEDDRMDGEIPDSSPISLVHLRELTLGYTYVEDARRVLKYVEAPNVTSLKISDNSSVLNSEMEDAGDLLIACGATALEGYEEIEGWPATDSDSEDEIEFLVSPPKPRTIRSSTRFPALEEITLERVKASSDAPFRTLFSKLTSLQHLTLQHTSMDAVQALMPHDEERSLQYLTSPTSTCPCPNLKFLHVIGAVFDFDLINNARNIRVQNGAYPFQPDVTVDQRPWGELTHLGAPNFEELELRLTIDQPYFIRGIAFDML